MNDEKYLFISDSRDKKNVARSARSKRTHCGKGGRVKLPSDYLSKKELNAMSGECKSYKLNEPMNWSEFKSMPDDIKITYIKLIREKFGASDTALADMFGVSGWSVCQEMKRLEIAVGKNHKNPRWDRETFLAWVNRVPVEKPVKPAEETQETEENLSNLEKPMKWEEFNAMSDEMKIKYIKRIRNIYNASDSQIAIMLEKNRRDFSTEINRLGLGLGRDRIGGCTKWDKEGFYEWIGKTEEVPVEVVEKFTQQLMPVEENPLVQNAKETEASVEESKPCVPKTGSLVFDGRIEDILKTVGTVLNGAEVHLSVHWEVINNG